MTHEELEALTVRWFERVWNQRDDEAIDDLMDEHVKIEGLSQDGQIVDGVRAFKDFRSKFLEVFPDLEVHIERFASFGDESIAWLKCTGTPDPSAFGFSTARRQVSFDCVSWARVSDGKFCWGRNLVDMGAIYRQLEGS